MKKVLNLITAEMLLNAVIKIPWFPKMFSRNRFKLLLKFSHLVNNEKLIPSGQPGYNSCAKFDPIVQHANVFTTIMFLTNR